MSSNKSAWWSVLICAPAAGTLALGAVALLLEGSPGSLLGSWVGPLFFFLAALAAVTTPVLVLLRRKDRREAAYYAREVSQVQGLLQARDAELRRLRNEMEILTAVREIGVIVNADDEFEVILSKVMDMVGQALKADDLVLFLADGASKTLEPVARHREGRCLFRGLKNPPIGMRNVTEALIHGRLLEAEEWNAWSFALPLVVEREAVGVLKVFVPPPLPGDVPRLEEAREFLRGVERHLALAIKAPSLYSRAVLDGLTGLYTRRHLDSQLEGHFSLAARRKTPLSFILCDIDHFKNINDTHGHPSGDRILKAVARLVLREIRKYDSAYRYGGEELCVLLPETDPEDALQIAERMRARIEKNPFKGDRNQAVPATISLGVASFAGWMTSPADLVAAADRALYRAKEGGRNRVEVETAPGAPSGAPARRKGARRGPRRRKEAAGKGKAGGKGRK